MGKNTPIGAEEFDESVLKKQPRLYIGYNTLKVGSKSKKKSEVVCFICGLVGHYARDCTQRKGADKALVVHLIAMREKVMFTRYDLLLDNQSSVDIKGNADLIDNQRKAARSINMCGIQRGA